MSVEMSALVVLLSNQFLKTVFKEVAKNRSMVFKDLQESVLKTLEVQREHADDQVIQELAARIPPEPNSAARQQLEDQRLKGVDLIKEQYSAARQQLEDQRLRGADLIKEQYSAARQQLEDAVQRLKDAGLIKERPASIEDFNRYSVTANGLVAERQLRLAESTSTQV